MENCHVHIHQDNMHAFSNLKQRRPAVGKSCSSQKGERKSALEMNRVTLDLTSFTKQNQAVLVVGLCGRARNGASHLREEK